MLSTVGRIILLFAVVMFHNFVLMRCISAFTCGQHHHRYHHHFYLPLSSTIMQVKMTKKWQVARTGK